MMLPQCRHCRRKHATRPRGLCWACYHMPDVRERYSSSHYSARHGVGIGGHGQMPAEPTDAPPGSEDKIRVLEERAARGESLFHPGDRETCEKAKRIKASVAFIGRIRKLHLSTQDRGGHAE